ncbi:hypothetical protein MJO29_008274 [Puccinia striiformis f. sp. tritici]|nr:hypothetical protein MJO29_008274 [Puccinia striiformis f. sp. tritici]KAI9602707.1 hypothetical protein H4Q26_002003 [Puccinia striiformis f. sp. tritici PST-130]
MPRNWCLDSPDPSDNENTPGFRAGSIVHFMVTTGSFGLTERVCTFVHTFYSRQARVMRKEGGIQIENKCTKFIESKSLKFSSFLLIRIDILLQQ